MNWRNRWMFWGLVTAVLALISVPSVEWVETLRDYASFAEGWEPSPLRPTRTSFTPREGRAPDAGEPEIKPVDFRYKSWRARSVELVGDFNAWTPGLLRMNRVGGGVWSLVVPLQVGRHKYLFLVDGEPKTDPGVETAEGPERRMVSVRVVR